MIELSFAYLSAAGLIAGLVLLARRNQQQGWHKHRAQWLEVQSNAAVRAFVAKPLPPDETLQHLADLDRLRQSLVAHNQPAPAEVPHTDKQEKLVPSH
jgi:hypothetical protein